MIQNKISKLNPNYLFIFIDLDGTLIDTDMVHFDAYVYAFSKFNIDLTFTMYRSIIEKENKMDNYLDKFYSDIKIHIKEHKNHYLLNIDKINLISYANVFIDFIETNNINHVVVTNTTKKVVESFKLKLPILNKLKNWIVREDYVQAKPHPECYLLGKRKFYSNEPIIIGIENSIHGYQSIKNVTSNIIIISNNTTPEYEYFSNIETLYITNDYNSIL